MADTHEEQLLNDVLREIGEADRGLSAAGLEARVLAAFDAAPARHPVRVWKPVVVASAAVVLLAIAGVWLSRDTPDPAAATGPTLAPSRPSATLAARPRSVPDVTPSASRAPNRRAAVDRARGARPPVHAPAIAEALEFVPLLPLAEHELSGPFQLVRVQVPAAALGGLTSPLQHPGELVEADVLLGQDGIARAIRITADESHYSRRFR